MISVARLSLSVTEYPEARMEVSRAAAGASVVAGAAGVASWAIAPAVSSATMAVVVMRVRNIYGSLVRGFMNKAVRHIAWLWRAARPGVHVNVTTAGPFRD